MPQFQPDFLYSQLFWLYAVFGVLLVLMSTVALPRVGRVLEERQRRIDTNLDAAAELKSAAEAAIAQYEGALAAARAASKAIVKEAVDAARHQAEEALKADAVKFALQVKAGEERIGAAKDQALAHIREVAAVVAQDAMARLTGIKVDEAVALAAIGTAEVSR